MAGTGFTKTVMGAENINARESMASKEALRKSIGRDSPDFDDGASIHKRSILIRRNQEADHLGDVLLSSLVGNNKW